MGVIGWYFFGSMIASAIALQILKGVTAPFFKVKSRIGLKSRYLSGSGSRSDLRERRKI